MRRVLALALACASLLPLISAVPAAAAQHGVTFNAILGLFPCVSGTGPAGQNLTISIKMPSRQLRGRARVQVRNNGQWGACFGTFGDQLNSGDRLIASAGSYRRVWTVPLLRLRIDRSTGTLSGQTI